MATVAAPEAGGTYSKKLGVEENDEEEVLVLEGGIDADAEAEVEPPASVRTVRGAGYATVPARSEAT